LDNPVKWGYPEAYNGIAPDQFKLQCFCYTFASMTTPKIISIVLLGIVTFALLVGSVAFLAKGLIANSKKEFIKMLILIAAIVIINYLGFYFLFR
jgi:hypothetical protein